MPSLVGSTEEAYAIAAFLTRDITVRPGRAVFARRVYRGQWNQLPDFDSLTPAKSDTVAKLSIDDIKPKNNFGVVFEAQLPITDDGEYEFSLRSDDGSSLSIAGNRLVNDFIHPEQTVRATYQLAAGVYPIRIEYFDGGGQIALSLKVTDPKFGTTDIATLIADPNDVDPDFLPSDFVVNESLVDEGRQWFVNARCKNCHAMNDDSDATTRPATQPPSYDSLEVDRGCLATTVMGPAVNYELNPPQRAALAAAITSRRSKASSSIDDADRIHQTMAALNCYACHARDKIGGPELSRDSLFKSTMPEMGLEGRLPPPLDGVGDKLNDAYFESALDKCANLRDYMATRMPAFSYPPLAELHRSFIAIDRSEAMTTADHSDSHAEIVAAGRQAVGNKGLACIKCHSFGGDKGGGLGAIDMLEMTNRLRAAWFQRYLQDPAGYRPGTRMPNSFPDGKSARKDLYGGDPIRQIDAMWQYLLQGQEAKEPEGLKQGAIVLGAGNKPRIYRNFFADVSSRGIAVAYPTGLNLIWDAETMTLARAWRNSFIDASLHWVGRGQGRQTPLGDAVIQIEDATPIARLESIDSTWPDSSGRDRGYRFKGYRLGASGNPIFSYSLGKVQVTDEPSPPDEADPTLIRIITVDQNRMTSSDPGTSQPLVWQFAAGNIAKTDDGFRINDKFTLSVNGVDCRIVNVGETRSLRALIPVGKATTFTETIRW